MREYYFNCGAGIETTCEAYTHNGQKACMLCNAAITYFNDVDDEIDCSLVDEFIDNIRRCNSCTGCEEGCSVCGVWFPYANYKAMPEFEEAQRIVALSGHHAYYPACDEIGNTCLWSERTPHAVYSSSCKGCKHEVLKEYKPTPVDTSDIELSYEIFQLADKLAENTHEVWATGRLKEGWTYGESRNDTLKKTPCMVPYDRLTSSEKEYDINTALETLKLIIKLGYKITK